MLKICRNWDLVLCGFLEKDGAIDMETKGTDSAFDFFLSWIAGTAGAGVGYTRRRNLSRYRSVSITLTGLYLFKKVLKRGVSSG